VKTAQDLQWHQNEISKLDFEIQKLAEKKNSHISAQSSLSQDLLTVETNVEINEKVTE
jgi:hypothetical protein